MNMKNGKHISAESPAMIKRSQLSGDLGMLRLRIDRGDPDVAGMSIQSIAMTGSAANAGNSPSTPTLRTAGLSSSSVVDRVMFPPTDGVGHIFYVSSTSVNDIDTTGTHARKIILIGLDADWNRLVEVILLNGQSVVATTKTNWLRVNLMVVIDIGVNGNSNDGNIFVSLTNDAILGIPQTDVIHNIQKEGGVSAMGVFSSARHQRVYFLRGSYYVDATPSKPLRNAEFAIEPTDGSSPNTSRLLLNIGELNVSTSVGFNVSGASSGGPFADVEWTVQSVMGTTNNYSIFWNTLRYSHPNF